MFPTRVPTIVPISDPEPVISSEEEEIEIENEVEEIAEESDKSYQLSLQGNKVRY